MDHPQSTTPLFTPPSADETAALQLAARYLLRAGTEAATKLLSCEPPDARLSLLSCLSDSLLSSAALCDGLTCSDLTALRAAELHRWGKMLP